MEDLDDLLTWRNAPQHFLAERFFAHARDEIFGNLVVNIRLQQSQADLPKRIGNVGLRNGPVTTEILKNILKPVGELSKHGVKLGPIVAIDWSRPVPLRPP